MHKKHFLILSILTMALLAACSPQQVENLAEETNVEEMVEEALRPITEEEIAAQLDEAYPAPETAEEEDSAVTESEAEVAEAYPAPDSAEEEMAEVAESDSADVDSGLAKLPPLAQTSAASGPPSAAGTGGGVSVAAESSGVALAPAADVMGSSMLVDPGFLFEQSAFVMPTSYPTVPLNLMVMQRIRSQATAELAQTIAAQNGFALPLYQEQLPIDMMGDQSIAQDGSFRGMPFIAFTGDQRITIMDGSVWMDTTNVEAVALFDPTRTFSEETLATLANERLADLNLAIEYDLDIQPFGNVLVHPIVNGLRVNQPIIGLYFDYDGSNEPFIRSMFMDLYSESTAVGEYPLLSAEDAWSNLIPGLSTGRVQWRFGNGAFPTEPIINDVESDIVEPLNWFVDSSRSSAESRNLYGWPTVFNPVADDGQPLIFVNGMLVQAPAEAGMLIATSPQGVFKMTGTYVDGENGQPSFAADSVTPIPSESQLFLQGDVVREGDAVFVDSPDYGRVQLVAPPADLPEGITVFVDGYQDGLAADGTTLLDWQYLSEAIDYSEEGGVSIETLPVPVDGFGFGLDNDALAEITIDSVEMGYGITWPQQSEELVDFAPIQSDFLIPIWTYSGTAADGTPVQFEIPAVDPAYFQN